eukprot:TRINITY_DN24932_c0_g1_i1.p1 TRINITY_DN24932_c0_g1~~TRINITY_DN24932_c0_g1_i1.p1  ORF type:complete len:406 (+),score=22.41 TRINITY_DN24932_c0_g1_i1:62-1219(+)
MEIEEAFTRLVPLFHEESGWETLCASRIAPGGLVSKMNVIGGPLLRFRYALQISQDASLTDRADAYPASSDTYNSWQVLKIMEPGECLISWSCGAVGTIFRLLEVLLGQQHIHLTNTQGTPWHYCQQRDFPAKDHVSTVLCPTADSAVDANMLLLYCHRPVEEHERTWMYQWGVFLPERSQPPVWAVEHLSALLEADYAFCARRYNSEETKLWHQLDVPFYMVVNLKRCGSGPPLLPAPEEEQADVVIAGQGWNRLESVLPLSVYLRSLLQGGGCSTVRVFQSLHGWQLVPYQAVVVRQEWTAAYPLISSLWARHEAAYKEVYDHRFSPGPHLAFDLPPRLTAQRNGQFRECPESMVVSVRNTFIDGCVDAESQGAEGLPRSQSF